MAEKIKELTAEEFNKLLEEQAPQYKNWADLEKGKIYVVTDTKMTTTFRGPGMILVLQDNGEVLAPNHLYKRVLEQRITTPFHVRPTGFKQCKNNPANKYHSYDLVRISR